MNSNNNEEKILIEIEKKLCVIEKKLDNTLKHINAIDYTADYGFVAFCAIGGLVMVILAYIEKK